MFLNLVVLLHADRKMILQKCTWPSLFSECPLCNTIRTRDLICRAIWRLLEEYKYHHPADLELHSSLWYHFTVGISKTETQSLQFQYAFHFRRFYGHYRLCFGCRQGPCFGKFERMNIILKLTNLQIGVGLPCKADGSLGNCASGFCLVGLPIFY